MPNESNVREEELISAHGSRVGSIVGAEAWLREREAAGHILASAVRKQRLKNSVFGSLSLLFLQY